MDGCALSGWPLALVVVVAIVAFVALLLAMLWSVAGVGDR